MLHVHVHVRKPWFLVIFALPSTDLELGNAAVVVVTVTTVVSVIAGAVVADFAMSSVAVEVGL